MTEAAESDSRPGAERPHSDRRRHERFALRQPVRVVHGAARHAGVLRDISLGGALAAVGTAIPPGASVTLETEGFGTLSGIVVRTVEPDLVGVQFTLDAAGAAAFQKILITAFHGAESGPAKAETPVEKHPSVP